MFESGETLNNIKFNLFVYLTMACLSAFIALIILILILIKNYLHKKMLKRHQLLELEIDDYFTFKLSILLNVFQNLTFIFSFTNFLTAVLTVIYAFLLIISNFLFYFFFKINYRLL
jgi:hypothetical protein